jgi:uncharacterized protein
MLKENLLPAQVEAFRLTDQAIQLQGKFCLKDMPRLLQSLHDPEGRVDAILEFGVDAQGVRFLHGQFTANVTLQCQRCMELFSHAMKGSFWGGMVSAEETEQHLPAKYDLLVIKNGILPVRDVFEDEMIIGLPVIPRHEAGQCQVKMPFIVQPDPEMSAGRDSPFKVIESLRLKSDS